MKRSDQSTTNEGSREINEPNYSKYDDDRGDAETKDVSDIMSGYPLTVPAAPARPGAALSRPKSS